MTTKNKWNKLISNYWKEKLQNSQILNSLNNDLKEDWNNLSLNFMDDFLKSYYNRITCEEVAAIYFKFWLDLKNIKGNSTNFVGFSEFLILRCVLHLINEEYFPLEKIKCNPKTQDVGNFSFGDKGIIVTTESIPKDFWDVDRRRPDIVIFREKPLNLIGIIQTKAFPASSAYVRKDLDFLKKLKNKNMHQGHANGLVIIFSRAYNLKEDEMICSLWNKTESISKILRNRLGLDMLKQQ